MKHNIFIQQIFRARKNLWTNVVILLVTTAFLCMSINLYSSSVANLQYAEETYRTIAVVELYGDVDLYGQLTAPNTEGHQGNLAVGVKGYDISGIVSSDCVLDYDLRARYAAYIEGEPAQSDANEENNITTFIHDEDIIRFTLERDEPVTIPINWSEDFGSYTDRSKPQAVYLNVSQAASQVLWYRKTQFISRGIIMASDAGPEDTESRDYYAQQVKQLNRNDDIYHVTLYPGVEYIAITHLRPGREIRDGSNGKYVGAQEFEPGGLNYFSSGMRVRYRDGLGESVSITGQMDSDQPFPIARWEDVQNDPVLKARWEGAWEGTKYNLCSYNVCLTDDITGVPVFHLGGAFLADGRMITEEEYQNGAKVCMVSKKMAQLQHWNVGDKLDMDFYQYEAFANRNDLSEISYPRYHEKTEGFFDSGEYEIVGIFDQKKLSGNSGIARSTMAMPWNMIFLPENAVQNTLPEEELIVHGALLTLWLENGSADRFLEDMDALGLTEKKDGQYNPAFTFYDQGYSAIQASLQSMNSTSRLLLMLSTLLMVITCVLLAWFFAQNQKQIVGIFRMLGGKKASALAAVTACALVITLLGAGLGAAAGHSLSVRVGETILRGSEEEELNSAFRAYVLAAAAEDQNQLTVEADSRLSALAACTALLFPVLILTFVLGYIGKEPRELLPKSRA